MIDRYWALLMLLCATSSSAMIFPHLDYSPHLEQGVPDASSFGTLVAGSNTELPLAASASDERGDDRFDRHLPRRVADASIEYLAQLEEGRYDNAVEAAGSLVVAVDETMGSDTPDYYMALSDLGAAHYHAGNLRDAIEPLRQSIVGMSRTLGVFDPTRVGAHAYLGMAYQGLEDHKSALAEFSRGQALMNRDQGAANLGQLKLIYAKAYSLEALGEWHDVEQAYRLGARLAVQAHGRSSKEALPARLVLAEWLAGAGKFRPSLTEYRRMLKDFEPIYGPDSPELLPILRGRAVTHLLHQSVDVDRGLSLHQRIVGIVESNAGNLSLDEQIAAHLDLGDWYLLFHREEEAWASYARAWEIAAGDDTRDWGTFFGEPKLVYAGPPLTLEFMGYQYVGHEADFDFSFAIETDGRPSHVKATTETLKNLMRSRAIRFFRMARFRPAMINGQPQRVDQFTFHRDYPTPAPDGFGEVQFNPGTGDRPQTRFDKVWPGR